MTHRPRRKVSNAGRVCYAECICGWGFAAPSSEAALRQVEAHCQRENGVQA